MVRINQERKEKVLSAVQELVLEQDRAPTVQELAECTGLPHATVHRYLKVLQEDGAIQYNGRRSVRTEASDKVASTVVLPVLGTVACGPGQEVEQELVEYIRLPESMVGRGDFFALIAKGESMVDAGVSPGDYVIVRRQQTAEEGQLIIALSEGRNNLKKLHYDQRRMKYVLKSCNRDRKAYPDIVVEELTIQGIVTGIFHKVVA